MLMWITHYKWVTNELKKNKQNVKLKQVGSASLINNQPYFIVEK